MITIIFGMLLSVALIALGYMSGRVSVVEVFAFQMVWYLILCFTVTVHRY